MSRDWKNNRMGQVIFLHKKQSRNMDLGALTNEQGIRRKRGTDRRKKVFRIFPVLIIFFLVGAGLYFQYLRPRMVEVLEVRPGILDLTVETEFLVIRDETVIPAPYQGQLEPLYQEGERIAKNTVVGYLVHTGGTSLETSEKLPLPAPRAGVLSYQADGYESLCNPEVWLRLDTDLVAGVIGGLDSKSLGDAKKTTNIPAGGFIYKIIDNLSPSYLYLEQPLAAMRVFEKGEVVGLQLNQIKDASLHGTVADVQVTNDVQRLLLRIPTLIGMEKQRKIAGRIVTARHEGLLVPTKVLITREGKEGVYLLRQGKAYWQEVTVQAQDTKNALIEGLNPGEWVITRPALIREGQRVFSPTP